MDTISPLTMLESTLVLFSEQLCESPRLTFTRRFAASQPLLLLLFWDGSCFEARFPQRIDTFCLIPFYVWIQQQVDVSYLELLGYGLGRYLHEQFVSSVIGMLHKSPNARKMDDLQSNQKFLSSLTECVDEKNDFWWEFLKARFPCLTFYAMATLHIIVQTHHIEDSSTRQTCFVQDSLQQVETYDPSYGLKNFVFSIFYY